MTDLERAVAILKEGGHTLVLVKDEEVITASGKGISPLLPLTEGDYTGFSAADMVVGKAAALLYAKLGVKAVYAELISRAAVETLKAHEIDCKWNTLTENILNRVGDGLCPMECAVANLSSPEEAVSALKAAVARMMANRN